MTAINEYQIIAAIEGVIILFLCCALSFYKSYYDQKQRNKAILDRMRNRPAAEQIGALLTGRVKGR